jgi:hypothetical protein
VFVFAFTTAAREVVPVFTRESVFALITAAKDVVAVVTSDCVASEPVSSVAAVSVRTAFDQTSETSVPNVLKERVVLFHTAEAIVVLATATGPTANDLSSFTRSPAISVPQLMTVLHTPSGAAAEIE